MSIESTIKDVIMPDGEGFDLRDWNNYSNEYRKLPVTVRALKLECSVIVNTLEGELWGNTGDYLIQGVKGEFYPCRADIFKKTYEKVRVKGGSMKTQKVEIEIPVFEGFEFVRYDSIHQGEYYYTSDRADLVKWYLASNGNISSLVYRKIEPPLELESDYFMAADGTDKLSVSRIVPYLRFADSVFRDLIKILTYIEQYKKFPDRVVVREVEDGR